MKAHVIGVSTVDHNGEYYPDGSERFTIEVNVKRGDEWNVFFSAYRDREPLNIDVPFASGESCDVCREMALLVNAIWRKASYTGREIEDMFHPILIGHTAQSVVDKFGIR